MTLFLKSFQLLLWRHVNWLPFIGHFLVYGDGAPYFYPPYLRNNVRSFVCMSHIIRKVLTWYCLFAITLSY